MAATFIFLSVLRTNTPSCIDLAMATLMSASMAEMKSGKVEKGWPKKNYHRMMMIIIQKRKGKDMEGNETNNFGKMNRG